MKFTIRPIPVTNPTAIISGRGLLMYHGAISLIAIILITFISPTYFALLSAFLVGSVISSFFSFIIFTIPNKEKYTWNEINHIVASVNKQIQHTLEKEIQSKPKDDFTEKS